MHIFLLYRIGTEMNQSSGKENKLKAIYSTWISSAIQEQLFLAVGLSFYVPALGWGQKNINTVWSLGMFLSFFLTSKSKKQEKSTEATIL